MRDTGGELELELSLPLLLLLPARALREMRVVGKSFGSDFLPASDVYAMPSSRELRRKFRSGMRLSATKQTLQTIWNAVNNTNMRT